MVDDCALRRYKLRTDDNLSRWSLRVLRQFRIRTQRFLDNLLQRRRVQLVLNIRQYRIVSLRVTLLFLQQFGITVIYCSSRSYVTVSICWFFSAPVSRITQKVGSEFLSNFERVRFGARSSRSDFMGGLIRIRQVSLYVAYR